MVRALFLILFLLPAAFAQGGDAPVRAVYDTWTDPKRQRMIPYKLYLPANVETPRPVLLFSHGLGGNRDSTSFLMEALAQAGYFALALQHPGSDTNSVVAQGLGPSADPAIMQALLTNALSRPVAVERFRDVSFAIDALIAMNADGPFKGQFDLKKIAVAGHSYGAVTALALAGQTMGAGESFNDPRVRAAVAFSPSVPRGADPAIAFASVRAPTFHLTGTLDGNPLDGVAGAAELAETLHALKIKPEQRLVPYASISRADSYLLVLNGGDHMVFSGKRLRNQVFATDAAFHALIKSATIAFLDWHLSAKPEARAFLHEGGLAASAGSIARYEFKQQTALRP
jgi:predicted dienelactone hydrolase